MPVPRRLPPVLAAALVAALLSLPAAAPAATVHSFANSQDLFPAGDANGTVGPANHYPSAIAVGGLAGTVTGVAVELVDLTSGRPEDIDMALQGPNGAVTMLMSDSCGAGPIAHRDWGFEDAAPIFLPSSCSGAQSEFKPTNKFEEGKGDDLSAEDGPPGPYLNSLAALAGGTPDGNWNLYVVDDSEGVVGFGIGGWELLLEVEPPPPAPPAAPVTAPPAAPGAAPAPSFAPLPAAPKTGKRAKALAACKAKKSKRARRTCRKAAKKLPR